MRKKRSSVRLQLAATACLVATLVSSCQTPSASPVPASASPTPTYYRGQNLPKQVESLSGTPLYSTSIELAKTAKLTNGAPFLLIAPQNPSQALLVIEPGITPEALLERPSNLSDFAGSTESLDAPELVNQVKDSFGLELKTGDDGKVVVLRLGPAQDETPGGETP